MPATNNISFNNNSQNRDHNIYTEEFLGGADVFIYINGKRYDDISAIQYSIREQQKPIYGYSSRVYDDIATGTRIVQGILKVPVRNTKYNEDLTFGIKNTITAQKQSKQIQSLIPDWTYNYTSQNIGTKNTAFPVSDNQGVVSEVQAELKKLGYSLDVTGLMDSSTKTAIYNYKKDNNLTVNNKCDIELRIRLGLYQNDHTYKTRVKSNLRYEPSNSSDVSESIDPNTTLTILKVIDDTWALVQVYGSRKGYLKLTEVY